MDGKEALVLRESGLPWLAERLGHPFNGVLAPDPEAFPTAPECAARLGLDPGDAVLAEVLAGCRDDHARGLPVSLAGGSYLAAWVRSGTGVVLGLPAGAVLALGKEVAARRAGPGT